jgi:rhombotail lipoprotein
MKRSFPSGARLATLVAVLVLAISAGCASADKDTRQRQVASVLEFLYPGTDAPPPPSDQVAVLNVPFRIGVVFVPDAADASFRLPETDRLRLAGRVRDAFAKYPFVRDIEAVPSMYLERGGSFANLDRVASLLRLDVIALISYDQVQHSGASGWSFLYWTGIGAYVIEGDRYDVLSAVETTVFDVRSRRLLMRAAGTATVKGSATMVGFGEQARQARTRSFEDAVEQMVDTLHGEVKRFRERAPNDPAIRLVLPPGYDPAMLRAGPGGRDAPAGPGGPAPR